MSQPDDARIQHMIEAARKAIAFAGGKTRTDLDDDEMLRFALVKLVEIVGEAAKQVTTETRAEYPSVALGGGGEDEGSARPSLLRHQPRRALVHGA